MFRTSYFYLQQELIVHAALYDMLSIVYASSLPSWRLSSILDRAYPSTCYTASINAWTTYHRRPHVQYSLPNDEHKMIETCRRQEELN